jgi:hypothetical protein
MILTISSSMSCHLQSHCHSHCVGLSTVVKGPFSFCYTSVRVFEVTGERCLDLQGVRRLSEFKCIIICSAFCWDSKVSIVTRYRLDSPGIESRCGQDFPHPFRPTLEPTQLPAQWYWLFFLSVKQLGRGVNTPPPPQLALRLKKE